jgi:hypothetical protein
MPRQATALASVVVALAFVIAGVANAADGPPMFVTNPIDQTTFLPGTSAACGFPVFEHDLGTVITQVSTMPDGSLRSHDVVVKIDTTFYSTDPAHTGTVTTRPSGPNIEIDHPDGSVTVHSSGQNGHVTIPGQGIVWASSGVTKGEIDASVNVTEVSHGNMSPTHAGICPLL